MRSDAKGLGEGEEGREAFGGLVTYPGWELKSPEKIRLVGSGCPTLKQMDKG